MGLRDLSVQTMVNLSEPWLNPDKDRPVLKKLPLIAPLLPVLDRVHQSLIANQSVTGEASAELEEIKEKQLDLDARHDQYIRGVASILDGFAAITQDPDKATALFDLRDRLLPEGLRAIQRSYQEEAGDAKLVFGRLDADSLSLLKHLPTPEGPLYNAVVAWTEAAIELGNLEVRRLELARLANSDDVVTPRSIQLARNEWIRTVRALQHSVMLESSVDEDLRHRILGPLEQAVARSRRSKPKAASTAPAAPAAPTNSTTAPSATTPAAPASPATPAKPSSNSPSNP